jgi:hypothetical protein
MDSGTDFPALFTEFSGKRFSLLWRGSRDGFTARLSQSLALIENSGTFSGLHAGVAELTRRGHG